MNNSNFNDLMNGKIDRKTIENAAKQGKPQELMNKLSDKDKQKINEILSDKQRLNEILSSPQAASILKILKGGNKNG